MTQSLLGSHHFLNTIIYKEKCAFKEDVLTGLLQKHKRLSSKYFYDEYGSELFNQITRHPDYYLTQCEMEILNHNKHKLASLFNEPFNLIELGPGEGIKTAILLEAFTNHKLDFTYTPIDISSRYLHELIRRFNACMPELKLQVINSDYFKGLETIKKNSSHKNLVLFLGSSIGNLDLLSAKAFLKHLAESLNPGDYLLIGFDMKKDIDILKKAYNDSAGLTREFNINLLNRINQQLGGFFDISQFFHYPNYNVSIGAMESFIVSQAAQEVYVRELDHYFNFDPFEPIHVEYSFKYCERQLQQFAEAAHLKIVDMLYDAKHFFVDALWRVCK